MFFGRFPAELGPETPLFGSGSKNGAEITLNDPRGPILRPFRDHFLVRTHNQNLKCVTKRRLGGVFWICLFSPGNVDLRAPDQGFRLKGAPEIADFVLEGGGW